MKAALCLIVLVGLAFLVRAGVAYRTDIGSEGCGYVMHAWSLTEGRLSTPYYAAGLDHYYPPLHPAMIWATHRLVDSWPRAAQGVSVIFSAMLLLPLFFLGRRLFHLEVGLFASALAAALPLLIFSGSGGHSLPIVLFLVPLSMLWGWRAIDQKSPLFALLAGLTLGLAYLAMVQSLVFLMALGFAYFWFWLLHRRMGAGLFLKLSLLSLVGFLLLAGPYEGNNYAKEHVWNLRSRLAFFLNWDLAGGPAGGGSLSETVLDKNADALYFLDLARERSPLAFIVDRPGEYGDRLLTALIGFYEKQGLSFIPLALFVLTSFLVLGIVLRRKDMIFALSAHLYLLIWMIVPFLGLLLFYGLDPFAPALTILPVLLFAACGVRALRLGAGRFMEDRVKPYFLGDKGIWVWLLLLLLLFPKTAWFEVITSPEKDGSSDQAEKEWFSQLTGGARGKIVLAPDPRTALDTGNYWYLLPSDYVGRLGLYAKAQKGDYLLWQGRGDGTAAGETPIDYLDQIVAPFDKAGLKFLGKAAFNEQDPIREVLYQVEEGTGKPASSERPNVILVSIDTLRADHLSCYGYGRDTSPYFDAIASKGVRFKTVISHAPKTATSHMTLFTSTWLDVHGVCQVVKQPRFTVLPGELRTLAQIMQDGGYRTAAFTGGSQIAGGFGFERGFEIYETNMGYQLFPESFQPVYQWLSERDQKEPFFLFLHTYQVHGPYCPPPPFDTRYDPDYDGPIKSDWDERAKQLAEGGYHETMRDVEHLEALYDGEIRYTDELFGQFFETLRKKGLLGDEKTLLIILSDHGEEFREHGAMGHEQLYRETMEVPLILYWPGKLPQGTVIPGQVRLIDVAPTVLDLVGLPPHPQMQGVTLKAPLQSGQRVNLSAYSKDPVDQRQSALRSDRWMFYDRGPKGEELYYPDMDPHERTNLMRFDKLSQGLSEDRRTLSEELKVFPSYSKRMKTLFEISRPGVFDRKDDNGGFELNEEQKKRLEALGYL